MSVVKRRPLRVNSPVKNDYNREPTCHTKAYRINRKYRGWLQRIDYLNCRFKRITIWHWNYLMNMRLNAYNIHIHLDNLQRYKKEVNYYLRQLGLFEKFKRAYNIIEDMIPKSPYNKEIEENGRFLIGSLYDHLND